METKFERIGQGARRLSIVIDYFHEYEELVKQRSYCIMSALGFSCINLNTLHSIPTAVSQRVKKHFILFLCSCGHIQLVQLLIEQYQCDVSATNSTGNTPLHYACR